MIILMVEIFIDKNIFKIDGKMIIEGERFSC